MHTMHTEKEGKLVSNREEDKIEESTSICLLKFITGDIKLILRSVLSLKPKHSV